MSGLGYGRLPTLPTRRRRRRKADSRSWSACLVRKWAMPSASQQPKTGTRPSSPRSTGRSDRPKMYTKCPFGLQSSERRMSTTLTPMDHRGNRAKYRHRYPVPARLLSSTDIQPIQPPTPIAYGVLAWPRGMCRRTPYPVFSLSLRHAVGQAPDCGVMSIIRSSEKPTTTATITSKCAV